MEEDLAEIFIKGFLGDGDDEEGGIYDGEFESSPMFRRFVYENNFSKNFSDRY